MSEREPTKEMAEIYRLRLPAETYMRVNELAAVLDKSMNALLVQIIEMYLGSLAAPLSDAMAHIRRIREDRK